MKKAIGVSPLMVKPFQMSGYSSNNTRDLFFQAVLPENVGIGSDFE